MFGVIGGDGWRGLRLVLGEVTLDDAGAFTLPEDAAARVGERCVLTPGSDIGLRLYPSAAWEEYMDDLEALPELRHEARLMVQLLRSNAVTVDADPNGVVSIPPFLRRLGHLGRHVTIACARDHVELWDPAERSDHSRTGDPRSHGVA